MIDILISFTLGCLVGGFITVGIIALVSIDKEEPK